MNLEDISTQLLFTTLPIWVEKKDGNTVTGTGFIFAPALDGSKDKTIPLLVTNKHVTQDAKKVLIEFVAAQDGEPKLDERHKVEIDGETQTKFVDDVNDLNILPIGGIIAQLKSMGKDVFIRTINPSLVPNNETLSNLAAIENITFIGYPSGLYDQSNIAPIVRTGITATPAWNKFRGKNQFLIDAGVFPGSSGSPVFIVNQGSYTTRQGITLGNRVLFLGILTQSLVRHESVSNVYLGLGVVVNSQIIKEFANSVINELVPQPKKAQ